MVAGHFNLGICFDTWRKAGTRDWFLMLTINGRGRIGHLHGDVMVTAGDVVILRPGVRHDYGSERLKTRWRFYWVHFLPPPDWMPWLVWPQAAPGMLRLRLPEGPVRQEVQRACAKMVRRGLVQSLHGEALAMNALAEVIIRCDAERARSQTNQLDPRIERAVNHCSLQLHRPIMLDELARIGGISPARFSRLFAQQMGVPPKRFLEQLRINRACRLLELTQAKVSSIAQQVGFESAFYFTRRFRRQIGCSPIEHRRHAWAK
jgi:AraC family transcriptional regulator, arabinose operon regulatory protein